MKKKILIIEDELEIAELLKERLVKEDFEVSYVEDGNKGLQMAVNDKPNLIILDLEILGKNGISVCRELKASPKTASIPIIVYTAHTGPGQAQEILKLGGDVYVSKTTPMAKLVDIVKEHVN